MIDTDCSLLTVTGGDLRVPLSTGGDTRYVNLDYAASAPSLAAVTAHVTEVLPYYASVHRGAGYASQVSTAAYENARSIVADFVGARPDDLTVFTRNTTDSIALAATLVPGRTVLFDIEHHANLLPWTAQGGTVLPTPGTIAGMLAALDAELRREPAALVALTGASNVTGEVLPLRAFADVAHRHGARLLIDGAQLVPHRRIHLAADGVDYLVFSGHKTYAPFGSGVIVGRRDWFDAAEPYLRGGGAVSQVTRDDAVWRSGAPRHEAGSPNVLGAVALARAVETLASLDEKAWQDHEHELRIRLSEGLDALPGVTVHRAFSDSDDSVGVVSFSIEGVPSRLLAAYLSAEWGIGVRDGLFCAHPLLARLGISEPALRASVGVGSQRDDVELLVTAVSQYLAAGPLLDYAVVDGQWAAVSDPRSRPAWGVVPENDESVACGD